MTNTAECLLARTPDVLDEVFRLRYECYRRKGAIEPHPEERFRDEFDDVPNSFSFLVRQQANPLATVRISVVKPDCGWIESPACRVYSGEPAFERIARASFVEASRLCFRRQARRDSFVQLLGNMAALGELYDVEWMVACPRVEHASTYQRLFGFRPLAEPRRYFGVSFETQLLGITREQLRHYVREETPMIQAWMDALERLVKRVDLCLGTRQLEHEHAFRRLPAAS